MAALLSLFVFVFSLPWMVFSIPTFTKIQFPPKAFGGESIAFEPVGEAFYTGVADGRILKYQAPDGFTDFAFTTPTRSKAECDGTTNLDLGPTCGRTFGLALHHATRQLYIADAYYGLQVVGPNGRLATQLVTSAEGQAFHFVNGLGVDQVTGVVYFTDSSGVYDFRQSQTISRDPGLFHWEATIITRQLAGTPVPIGQRINAFGVILDTISFEAQYGTTPISEVQPFGLALCIFSRSADFVGVLRP